MIPAVHHRDRVGHRHGLLLVVGDVHEGLADLVLDPLDLDLHRAPQLEVEGTEGLVEQQHLRLVDEGAGQGDALLLATRELGGLLARLAGQLDQLEHLVDLGVHVRLLAPAQPERDVLEDVEVREEGVALEDRVHGPPVGLREGDVLAAQGDGPGRGRLEPGHHPQGRGLPAAGRPEEREERPARDVEVQVVHRRERTEGLGHLPEPEPVEAFVPGDGSSRPAQPPVTSEKSLSYSTVWRSSSGMKSKATDSVFSSGKISWLSTRDGSIFSIACRAPSTGQM